MGNIDKKQGSENGRDLDKTAEELFEELNCLKEAAYNRGLELHQTKMALEKATSEIDYELDLARQVQTGLLPGELPELINVKTASVYIPAGKVGGDLFDVIVTPKQKIAVLIFDVSGHGVSAALIAAMAKMLFARFIEKYDSPASIFTEVNRHLCEFLKTDHYLTAFLGIIDLISNTMTYSRAGHVSPVVYSASKKSVKKLHGRGYFIGHSALKDVVEYKDESVQLLSGDKVLFYTDGLTEGSNRKNELYSIERLVRAVKKNGKKPVEELIDSILEDQIKFREGQPLRDDFTLLSIEVGNPEKLLSESGFKADDRPEILMARTYGDIDLLCSRILRGMDENGFTDRDIKSTKICFFEMLINAIEHGNLFNPAKHVLVLYKITIEKAVISVIDEGNGFDYDNLPHPLHEQNLLKDHGRGVFITRQYMDKVNFNSKGNRIMVTKYSSRGTGDGN